ncbi:MAG: beta-ketoacyl-ACP synthase III [Pseudomonadota bacterium]
MSFIRATITSVGKFLPERVVTNKDLEEIIDTSDEWITQRTGIRTRHFLEPGLGNSYMSSRAAKDCLEKAGVLPSEIDVIIVGTVTPDMLFPATACLVQRILNADNAWGFDLGAGCSGFLFGLTTGAQFIESGRYKKVLVIGSDVNTIYLTPEDRSTYVLFGDGAGAVLLEPSEDPDLGIIDFEKHIDGAGAPYLHVKGGGSKNPPTLKTVKNNEHFVYQDGKAVFKYAVKNMADVAIAMMERNNIQNGDLDLFIPHQANMRIIEACAKRMNIDSSKVVINIDKYANTTSGTIPLCLADAVDEGRLKKGDRVIIAAFGAGFTWGGVYLRWSMNNYLPKK